MRLVKHYVFNIKTKIPFSELPEIVHRFMSENYLTSHRFLYFFEDILDYNETKDEALPRSSCAKILKDCPSLGEIRYHNGRSHNRSDRLWLSNIDRSDDFSESNLLPLMKKIHRRYGFCESNLYYFDIDFFGKRTCFERDYSTALQMSKTDKIPFDPTLYMECQPYGSGITLHRDACAENYLKLSVDLLHDGIVMDATPYYEAMQKLLPQIKATASLSDLMKEHPEHRAEARQDLQFLNAQKMGEHEAEIEKIKNVFLSILRDIKKDMDNGEQPGEAVTAAMFQTMQDALVEQKQEPLSMDNVTAMIAGQIGQLLPMDEETSKQFQALAKKMMVQMSKSIDKKKGD